MSIHKKIYLFYWGTKIITNERRNPLKCKILLNTFNELIDCKYTNRSQLQVLGNVLTIWCVKDTIDCNPTDYNLYGRSVGNLCPSHGRYSVNATGIFSLWLHFKTQSFGRVRYMLIIGNFQNRLSSFSTYIGFLRLHWQ